MEKTTLLEKEFARKSFLPPFRPTIEDEEIKEVINTLKTDWITTGPKTKKFEDLFKKYVDSKNAIALSSCTAALHLSLIAAGVDEGDEVITSPFTFTSTANVVIHQRAKPVFVDIKKDTYNIDPEKIEEAITDKTKAIIAVHYAGQPCEMDEILKIAKKNDLLVIEDAAHATGSKYKGKKIGSIGDFTCFSFYAIKNITTAEGGMITTNNDELAEKIRILSLHGISKDAWKRYSQAGSWYYEVLFPGYKYNMTDIQASLGIHQLNKIENFIESKEKIAEIYTKAFADMPEITEPYIKDNINHSWHLYPILINPDFLKINRNKFIEKLKEENIGTSVHFIPVHMHPYYREKFGFKPGDYPNAENIFNRIISLPLYPKMTDKDAEDVIKAVGRIIDQNKK